MALNTAELGRLAGISRSQASRWGRGAHQPAYLNVRQLGVAVYRKYPGLAQELMTAAGYPGITEEDMAAEPGPLDDLAPFDSWEKQVVAEPAIPDRTKRQMIAEWRRARGEARRRGQNGAHATGAA